MPPTAFDKRPAYAGRSLRLPLRHLEDVFGDVVAKLWRAQGLPLDGLDHPDTWLPAPPVYRFSEQLVRHLSGGKLPPSDDPLWTVFREAGHVSLHALQGQRLGSVIGALTSADVVYANLPSLMRIGDRLNTCRVVRQRPGETVLELTFPHGPEPSGLWWTRLGRLEAVPTLFGKRPARMVWEPVEGSSSIGFRVRVTLRYSRPNSRALVPLAYMTGTALVSGVLGYIAAGGTSALLAAAWGGMVGLGVLGWMRAMRTDRFQLEDARRYLEELEEHDSRRLALVEAQRQITEREARLREAAKLEALGRLAGGLCHDLSNTLTIVSGSSEIARATLPDGHPAEEDLDEIDLAVRRASTLTRQLQAMARRQVAERVPTDLGEWLDATEPLLGQLVAGTPPVQLTVTGSTQESIARIDATRLLTTVTGLVVNAREAMPGGGALEVRVDRLRLDRPLDAVNGQTLVPGDYLRLVVRDTGLGMTPDVEARATRPFYTTKPEGEGTGLGLTMAAATAKDFGGGLRIDSTPGRGTSVAIYMPAEPAAPADDAQDALSRRAFTAREPTEGLALVVDPSPAGRELAARALEARGYEVVEADGAESAFARVMARGEPLEMLVAEVVLPGMDGVALARALRRRVPSLRVVLIAGDTQLPAVSGVAPVGARVVTKPVGAEALLDAIESAPRPPRVREDSDAMSIPLA